VPHPRRKDDSSNGKDDREARTAASFARGRSPGPHLGRDIVRTGMPRQRPPPPGANVAGMSTRSRVVAPGLEARRTRPSRRRWPAASTTPRQPYHGELLHAVQTEAPAASRSGRRTLDAHPGRRRFSAVTTAAACASPTARPPNVDAGAGSRPRAASGPGGGRGASLDGAGDADARPGLGPAAPTDVLLARTARRSSRARAGGSLRGLERTWSTICSSVVAPGLPAASAEEVPAP